jgi:hypothetical protein
MDGNIYLTAVPFDSVFFGRVIFQGAGAKNSAGRVRQVVYEISLKVLPWGFVLSELMWEVEEGVVPNGKAFDLLTGCGFGDRSEGEVVLSVLIAVFQNKERLEGSP